VNVLLCPLTEPGYLYPSIAVGLELRRRGADVHVLGADPAAPFLAEAGLSFLAAHDYGGRRSFSVVRWFREVPGQYAAVVRAAREVRADVLVTSVLCHGALLAAETLDVPVVVIGLATHLWRYSAGAAAEPEQPALRVWRTGDMIRLYNEGRERVGFPALTLDDPRPLLGTALLLRGDPALEYPGAVLPDRVHHVGPCAWEPRADPPDLDELLHRLDRTGKPVVYVHVGRVFRGTSPWPRLNAAFTGGPLQAVVEVGRSEDPRPAPEADLVVVRKPWMGPLIDRAELVLSSGTSAPVLNALLRGRPLGLSPGWSEQPLLAEACVRAGVGSYLPNDGDRDPQVALLSVWQRRDLRARAEEFGTRLAAAGACGQAADIVAAAAGAATAVPRLVRN
jgi:UDP:flavonoid glycosyltransferase YjiC (YdhE family)